MAAAPSRCQHRTDDGLSAACSGLLAGKQLCPSVHAGLVLHLRTWPRCAVDRAFGPEARGRQNVLLAKPRISPECFAPAVAGCATQSRCARHAGLAGRPAGDLTLHAPSSLSIQPSHQAGRRCASLALWSHLEGRATQRTAIGDSATRGACVYWNWLDTVRLADGRRSSPSGRLRSPKVKPAGRSCRVGAVQPRAARDATVSRWTSKVHGCQHTSWPPVQQVGPRCRASAREDDHAHSGLLRRL